MCPHCKSKQIRKRGFYRRVHGKPQKIQRFLCNGCRRTFSSQTDAFDRGEIKAHITPIIFRVLMSGVSQRRCARLVGVDRKTVARKLERMADHVRVNASRLETVCKTKVVVFDEMETFEHTKCKPVSIAVAVEEDTRKIIHAKVAQMPAKGRLAKLSRKRYGYRKDLRPCALRAVLQRVKSVCPELEVIKSDQSPRYPKPVRRYIGGSVRHQTYKGRRGCVVGQGELKRGGHDPLFSLNHTCAMFRDNIKRLSRRTWCTSKRIDRLQDLVDLYVIYHNAIIDGQKRPMSPYLSGGIDPRIGASL